MVLCVHGLARNSRDFDYLAEVLARDCRVVCMDVVGRGDSDRLEDKSCYRFSTYLSDAAALVARITTPIRSSFLTGLQARLSGRSQATKLDWVGTSMGGLIGMLLAAKRGSPIRRLVLNDVGPFVPWNALVRLKGHVGNTGPFASAEEVEQYVREACASFGPLTDEHWRHLAQHSARQEEDGTFVLRYDPAISQGLPPHLDPELPMDWKSCAASTSGACGMRCNARCWCCEVPNRTCRPARPWKKCRSARRTCRWWNSPGSAMCRRWSMTSRFRWCAISSSQTTPRNR